MNTPSTASSLSAAAGHPEAEDAGGRIVGGSAASQGQFPHQAAVSMDSSHLCGGSHISTSAVITAAHCVSGFSTWAVILGGIRRSGSESGRVTINTRSTTVHSGYNANTLNNDIAVIFLGTNVQLSSYIALVNLPSRSQAGNSFEGQTATVSGWGLTADSYIGLVNLPSRSQASNSFEGQTATVSGWGLITDNGVIPDTLQYTTLSVMSNTQCSQYYGGPIYDFTLCAVGSSGQSTCNGDSGGALVVGSQGSYTQIGIVSWGSGNGCASGDPAGFTRVTYFLDWISSTAGITIP
ncbi:brachyurin-like [Schistocerca serialis cubense]|uniref:brachyurin-like n=1 Tax=Schistocerca serialis cubense TaxID=2023355 RepID=UPI00214F5937|nr:brachyurin-like [Schistocerca serialis cubense]